MHTVRTDRPVEPILVELLSRVDRTVRALNLSYFIGGAFARDLLLVHVHGFDVPRPTRDVDIGIAVLSWSDFDRLKNTLTETQKFSIVDGVAHRLIFKATDSSRGIPLDIVPFSGVEESGGTLRWPPDRSVVMNVMGFEEALAKAEQLRISDDNVVPVASIPGQALLKLAAWLDRRLTTPRDATDLSMLFRRYGDAGNMNRLYDEKPNLLEAADFDIERAGAKLLGEDVRAIASPVVYKHISNAFMTPELQDRFLTDVSSGVAITVDNRVARTKVLVDDFFAGFGTNTKSS